MPPDEIDLVLEMKAKYAGYWNLEDNDYWLARLMQEVGEAASVLANDHDDTLEHELRQIASIALNWLEKLEREKYITSR
jgi:hypothetical protein